MKNNFPSIGLVLLIVMFFIVIPSLQGCANYDWQFNKHYTQQ